MLSCGEGRTARRAAAATGVPVTDPATRARGAPAACRPGLLPQLLVIRLARPEDLPVLREVERSAGALFRDLGMHVVAEDEPPSVADLLAFQQDGRAWVATDAADRPVGYLLVDVVDGAAHVEQVSLHPAHGRQGLGRALLLAAFAWAERQGLGAVTLTTFAHVAWNAPYYQRLGFQVLREDELGEGLRRLRDHEASRGLDTWPRVAMHRPLTAPGNSR